MRRFTRRANLVFARVQRTGICAKVAAGVSGGYLPGALWMGRYAVGEFRIYSLGLFRWLAGQFTSFLNFPLIPALIQMLFQACCLLL